VLTRSTLLQTVWRADPTVNTRTVDKHVEVLRRKLGAFGRKVETVFGVGYCLRA
jgi:two-component system alkaline phosphatase synthesis response regulator PhoP